MPLLDEKGNLISAARRRSAERAARRASHLAHAFGLVDAERVDLDLGVARMRKPRCGETETGTLSVAMMIGWRNCPSQGRNCCLMPLNGASWSSGPWTKAATVAKSAVGIAGHCLADGARRDIGLVVDRQYHALEGLLEIVVGLGRAPFLVAGAPGRGDEPGRARHGPRVGAAAKRAYRGRTTWSSSATTMI